MGDPRVCPYCGAWAAPGVHECQLCGRSVGSVREAAAATRGFERATSYSAASAPIKDVIRSLARGTSPAAIATGPAFILGYPWLLAFYAAQPAHSITSDLALALVWLAPELYLLSGVVKAAEYANANRRVAYGLIPPAVSLLLQFMVLSLARRMAPASSALVVVWGASGSTLTRVGPLATFALASAVAAVIAAMMPRVVPGKFGRTIGPQLLGLSVLLVALMLPSYGGLALIRLGLDIGLPMLWVNVLSVFIFTGFAFFWFRSKD